jgi:hypothetical protein
MCVADEIAMHNAACSSYLWGGAPTIGMLPAGAVKAAAAQGRVAASLGKIAHAATKDWGAAGNNAAETAAATAASSSSLGITSASVQVETARGAARRAAEAAAAAANSANQAVQEMQTAVYRGRLGWWASEDRMLWIIFIAQCCMSALTLGFCVVMLAAVGAGTGLGYYPPVITGVVGYFMPNEAGSTNSRLQQGLD